MIDTEFTREVKAKWTLWVGISLIVIGSIPIVFGIIIYYLEEVNCINPGFICPAPFHSWGGMGVLLVNLLGSIFFIPGLYLAITYKIRKRGLGCIVLVLGLILAGVLSALTAILI